MDSVRHVINSWLEGGTYRVQEAENELRKMYLQLKYDGCCTGNVESWIKFLHSLDGDKEEMLKHLLPLFGDGQLSLEIVIQIILKKKIM